MRSALLTGMLGLQPRPTVAEAAAYLLYAVPMLAYVLWPAAARRAVRQPAEARPLARWSRRVRRVAHLGAAGGARLVAAGCGGRVRRAVQTGPASRAVAVKHHRRRLRPAKLDAAGRPDDVRGATTAPAR